jgi:hypothetical protein
VVLGGDGLLDERLVENVAVDLDAVLGLDEVGAEPGRVVPVEDGEARELDALALQDAVDFPAILLGNGKFKTTRKEKKGAKNMLDGRKRGPK